jgi:hypothetical protein
LTRIKAISRSSRTGLWSGAVKRRLICCLALLAAGGYGAKGGEAERVKELTGILKQEGIDFEEHSLAEYGGSGSSIFVRLPAADGGGNTEKRPSFILVVPLSQREDREDAFPFRFETALWFMRKNRAAPPSISMTAVFLGREALPAVNGGAAGHPGLEELAVFLEEPEDTPLIYLGLGSPSGKIHIYHGSAGYISPLNLLMPFTDLLTQRRIPYSLAYRYAGLYRFRLAEGSAALGFLQSRGVPALALTAGADAAAMPGQSPLDAETLGALLADYSAGLNFSFEQADTRYTVFVSGQRTRYLPERAAVLLVLFLGGICLALFLAYSVSHRRRIRLLWSRGIAFFWVGPLLFGILVFCCLGAGILLTKILSAYIVPLSAVHTGGAFLVMLTGGALFSLAVLLLDGLPVKGKAGLYGNTTFFMSALGLAAGIFWDISLSPALLWILLCAFLGSSLKQALWVLICALLSLMTPLSILVDSAGTSRFMVLFQSEYRLFFLGFVTLSLPFYLLTIRAALLYRRRRRRYPPWQRRIVPRLVFLAFILWGLFLYSGRLSAGQTG